MKPPDGPVSVKAAKQITSKSIICKNKTTFFINMFRPFKGRNKKGYDAIDLDVRINNNSEFTTSVFHKSTYTGLLLNYHSFTSSVYKTGLVKDLQETFKNFKRNMYPQFIIDKVVKNYLDKTFTTPQNVCESIVITYAILNYPTLVSTLTPHKQNLFLLRISFAKLPKLN